MHIRPMPPPLRKRLWSSAADMENRLIQAALTAGAAGAAALLGEQITYSESFREICRGNQCGCYGKCWVCPPEIGEIKTLIAAAKAFPRAVLYQTIGTLEDSFDVEGMFAAGASHAKVSQRLNRMLIVFSKQIDTSVLNYNNDIRTCFWTVCI